MELKGQAIIITGGASGIGYQAALQMAAKGADLIIAGPGPSGSWEQIVYSVYKDHLGSLVALTKTEGSTVTVVAEQNFDAWGRRRNPATWEYTSLPFLPDWLYRGYTGHEHVEPFALINMNGRMYDPLNGRMLSADNYVQGGLGTQGYNRYSYAGNNPLKYTDPDGENPLAIAAIIGGTLNWLAHGAEFSMDGLGYFAIGAGAGALGAGVGAGISSVLAEGSLGTGLIGASTVSATGFGAGALAGATGGFTGGFVLGFGNTWHNGATFNASVDKGFSQGLTGAAFGGAIGGLYGGIDAIRHNRGFFTGSFKTYPLPDGAVAQSGQYPVFGGTPDGATVVNSDDVRVAYMPEDMKAGLNDVIPPGRYIKGRVEGIATRLRGDMVFKMPDYSTAVVQRGGYVALSNTWMAELRQAFQPSYRWGWLGKEFFRSAGAMEQWQPLFDHAFNLQFIRP